MTRPITCIFFMTLLFVSNVLMAQNAVQTILESRISQGDSQGRVSVDGIELFSQKALPKFYSNRDFEMAWTDEQNKIDLIESLRSSYDEGLRPEDYHLKRILSLVEKAKKDALDPEEKANLDLLMTDALILYASHLMDGKLDQSDFRKQWDLERNLGPSNPDSLLTITLHNRKIKVALEELKPKHYMYKLMKFHLKNLRDQSAKGGWPMVSEGEALELGDTGERVVEIRNYLKAVGDLKASETASPEVFDEVLDEAVRHFQFRHKLTDDGVIGKGTIEQMRVPVEDRIDMLLLNLERTRWIFHEPDPDFLLVNIAGFHVRRFQNNQEVFESRVIVGKYQRETPVFKGKMEYIVMNPTWTLPYSIATHETLPRLKKDPGYLSAKHMEVLDGSGKLLDPSHINWNKYSAGNFPFVIRQKAGPWNALGQVKFIFPNKYAVYLHDTPSRSLFDMQDRAFSHGCIRTEDKWGLFMSLMDDPEVWNMDKINEILESGETTTIDLPKPVNIYLIYLTTTVDQDNNLIFMKDIYKRDQAVLKALKTPFAFRPAN